VRAAFEEVNGRTHDRVGVDAEVAIQIGDVSGLAEVADSQTRDRLTTHSGQERQRMRVPIQDSDDRSSPIDREQHVEDACIACSQAVPRLQRAEDEICRGQADDIGGHAGLLELVRRPNKLGHDRPDTNQRDLRHGCALTQPVAAGQHVPAALVARRAGGRDGVPLSRRSVADVHRLVIERGITEASVSTIVRWLREDAIRPWQYRSWIFPTDPEFATKAGRILDLDQGRWDGELLHPGDMIISAEEKPSIHARGRIAETLPPAAGVPRGQRVEHTYERNGAVTYLAAWDVRRGGVTGRCEPKGGIEPFGRLVEQVMTREPYASAPRVFWIVDNGSSHRGKRSVERLQGQWRTLRLVHTPVHASW
jgi:hypothetical protein